MTDGAKSASGTPIAVLDPDSEAMIEAAGFPVTVVATLDALVATLGEGQLKVAVIGFEKLWPRPEEKLKELKARAPVARLVVVHDPGSPRLRLAQRLWSAGVLDYLVPRSVRHAELATIIRQAVAQADRAASAPRAPVLDLAAPNDRLSFLHGLFAALAQQSTEAGLLRELHQRLSSLVPYVALQVYLPSDGGFWVRQFQTRPLPHEAMQLLTQRSLEVLARSLDREVPIDSLSTEDAAPVPSGAGLPALSSEALTPVVVPLTAPSTETGCLSILVNGTETQAAHAAQLVEMISFHVAAALGQAQRQQEDERDSTVDPVTGLHNRRWLEQLLDLEWGRCVRYDLPLTAALIELDHFDRIVGTLGPAAGERAVVALADLLKARLRATDHLARDVGSRFVMLLPQTEPHNAHAVLERVRLDATAHVPGLGDEAVDLSLSWGVAGYPAAKALGPTGLLRTAEAQLTEAKQAAGEGPAGGEPITGADELNEARRSPRVPSKLQIRYIEIPDFESGLARATTADISARGLAIDSPGGQLKKGAFGLVFFEESHKPALTQVVWTTDKEGGQRAGLRMVESKELERLAHGDRERKAALKAVVVTSNPQTRAMVGRVLRAARYETTFHEGARSGPLPPCDLLVVGDSALDEVLEPQLRALSSPEAAAAARVVVINESGDRRAALDTLMSHQVRHLVAADESSDEVLFAALNKLLLGEYFGVRKYLLWGAQSKSWTVAYGETKTAVLEGIRNTAAEVRCHPRVADLLVTAVDEMLINALYRAPPESTAAARPVTVHAGSDGRLLVVSVRDEYGRFTAGDLYASLSRSREYQTQALSPERGHAQLGFRIMLDALSQLAINVDPGKATEIIGIVDLRKSLKEYRSSVPTFNLFTK